MLELKDIHAAYGKVQVLFGIDLVAKPGEVLCLLGRNGAGKTTLMQVIMGLLPVQSGSISLHGEDITSLPAHMRPMRRIGYVPQGRRLFPEFTVAENIEMGMLAHGSKKEVAEKALAMFPRLRERLHQQAGTLSGGEQQMLATARALCVEPEVLLLDEPTEGLQPSMIALIREVITEMKKNGLAVILVEQRVDAILSVADRVAFMEHGRSPETVPAEALRKSHEKIHKYLGV